MSVESYGTMENYLQTDVLSSVDTAAGAAWLASYIDPAHGGCDTYPDEDNHPSIAIKSNFTISIDSTFFVSSDYGGTVPSSFSFTVYGTSVPEWPIMVVGLYYWRTPSGIDASGYRGVLIPDSQLYNFAGGTNGTFAGISELRAMYKGFTMTYTGNQYNNEGTIVAAPVTISNILSEKSGAAVGNFVMVRTSELPFGSDNISNSNLLFRSLNLWDGGYFVQQITGTRSEYVTRNTIEFDTLDANGVEVGWSASYTGFCSYANRFREYTTTPPSILFNCNLNWMCASVNNMNAQQSLLLRVYAGYQCHYIYTSGYSVIQNNKSFLDMSALILASQINSRVLSVYPSSFNRFKKVWNYVKGIIRTPLVRSALRGMSAVNPLFGAVNTLIGTLCSVCYKHFQEKYLRKSLAYLPNISLIRFAASFLSL